MSNILIQNQGELPIWGIRLLGLSDKTDEQIGQFGTGLKESIALLARLDALPLIFSGTCKIDFQVMNDPNEIHMRLSEDRDQFKAGEWYGLGIHPNFGHHDWDDPWMVFRETICNAIDASGVDNLYHDIVQTVPEGSEGSTRIYIRDILPLKKAYLDTPDKILLLSKFNVASNVEGFGQILDKRKEKGLQVFYRNVWVQSHHKRSIFDYQITDLKLNESRSADWYDVRSRIAGMMAYFTKDQAAKILREFAVEDGDMEIYEIENLHSAQFYADVRCSIGWKEAFYEIWGANAVMTDNDKFYYDKLKQAGKKPVIMMHSGLKSLLKAAGVPDATEVLQTSDLMYDKTYEPTPDNRQMFDKVWDRMKSLGLTGDAQKPALKFFSKPPNSNSVTFGLYNNGVCMINRDCIGSVFERQACIEEIAHHITGAADETRDFQNFFLKCIDTLMFDGIEV